MADDNYIMTPFDRITSTKQLELVKLLIPYLPPNNQRFLGIYVKFLELRHTLSFFYNCNKPSEDFLKCLSSYLPKDTYEQFENAMNIMNMMQMMQEMSEAPDNPMSMMKDMLSPEQQEMLNYYQTIFSEQEEPET